jgi:hypothetical protein
MSRSKFDFVRQQGFAQADADSGHDLYSALMFQPRIVAAIVLTGILLQHPAVFATLSAVLLWSALVPRRNPFDALYNRLLAHPRRLRPLAVAPGPRRFAQGVAATVAGAIAGALLLKWTATAWAFEALLGIAVVGVVFGQFCAGAYLHDLLRSALAATTRRRPPVRQSGAHRGSLSRRSRAADETSVAWSLVRVGAHESLTDDARAERVAVAEILSRRGGNYVN